VKPCSLAALFSATLLPLAVSGCGEPEPVPEIEEALEAAEGGLEVLGQMIEVAQGLEEVEDLDATAKAASDAFAEHAKNVLMGTVPEAPPRDGPLPTEEGATAETPADGETEPDAGDTPAAKTRPANHPPATESE